ncbi:MAG: hypothetical protein EXR79_04920 [Myxococcales bacterium]|nr:hypothetical protein [Myxococcales bacterium]
MRTLAIGVLALACGGAIGLLASGLLLRDLRVAPPFDIDAFEGSTVPASLPPAPVATRVQIAPDPTETQGRVAEPAGPDPPDAMRSGSTPDAEAGGGILVPAPLDGTVAAAPDWSLIPRGPGRFALLDLAAAHLGAVALRAGRLERDGARQPRAFTSAPKLAVLRGERVRVELLHVATDAEAQPILAHVRTAAGLEGIVLLRSGGLAIRLLPDAAEAKGPHDTESAPVVEP